MVGTPRRRQTRFTDADLGWAGDQLADVIAELRPHVVVTYDPDGGYGHRITFRRTGSPPPRWPPPPAGRFRSSTGPSFPPAHFGPAWVAELRDVGDDWIWPPGDIPFGFDDDQITAMVNAPDRLPQKAAAISAHATQIEMGPTGRAFALSNKIVLPILTREHYVLVSGRPDATDERVGNTTFSPVWIYDRPRRIADCPGCARSAGSRRRVVRPGWCADVADIISAGCPSRSARYWSGLVNAALVWAAAHWTDNPRVAGLPLWTWLATVAVLTLGGPGGDIVFGGPGIMGYAVLLLMVLGPCRVSSDAEPDALNVPGQRAGRRAAPAEVPASSAAARAFGAVAADRWPGRAARLGLGVASATESPAPRVGRASGFWRRSRNIVGRGDGIADWAAVLIDRAAVLVGRHDGIVVRGAGRTGRCDVVVGRGVFSSSAAMLVVAGATSSSAVGVVVVIGAPASCPPGASSSAAVTSVAAAGAAVSAATVALQRTGGLDRGTQAWQERR